MFPHIIRNPKLVRNPQNRWKHHRIRLAETDTKLAALLLKLHSPNKGGLSPSCTWIKCNKALSWCSKGFPSSALAETCTTSPFNTYFKKIWPWIKTCIKQSKINNIKGSTNTILNWKTNSIGIVIDPL
jgi:hypothetical protein